jgi:hypothetical protein
VSTIEEANLERPIKVGQPEREGRDTHDVDQATPDDWDTPSGLRIGTTEVTRYGMKEAEMEVIADLMASVISRRRLPAEVRPHVIDLRLSFSRLHYCYAPVRTTSGVSDDA